MTRLDGGSLATCRTVHIVGVWGREGVQDFVWRWDTDCWCRGGPDGTLKAALTVTEALRAVCVASRNEMFG